MGRKASGVVGVEHLLKCQQAVTEIAEVLARHNLSARRTRVAKKARGDSSARGDSMPSEASEAEGGS